MAEVTEFVVAFAVLPAFVALEVALVAAVTEFVAAGRELVATGMEFVATGKEFVADRREAVMALSSRARAAGLPSTMTFGVAEGIAVPGVQRS